MAQDLRCLASRWKMIHATASRACEGPASGLGGRLRGAGSLCESGFRLLCPSRGSPGALLGCAKGLMGRLGALSGPLGPS